LLTDECKAWAPWIVRWIIARAVRNSPEKMRERPAEEWSSYVGEVPGDIGKLIAALGFFQASCIFSRIGQRALDLTLGSTAMALLAPNLIVAGAMIWLTSPGPVLTMQRRIGRNGKPFLLYRFRCSDNRVGKFIRGTVIQELPMLINVLRGDMSLVGPPPLIKSFPQDRIPNADVRPGIFIDDEEVHHAQSRSLVSDFRIILRGAVSLFFIRK
jgi:Bacterial sugar transferase